MKIKNIVIVLALCFFSAVNAKNVNTGIHRVFKLGKIHVQLQRTPQLLARFLFVRRADQQIQRVRMTRKQV